MEREIKKTKTGIYLLLVVFTVVYAFMSYVFIEQDLEQRIMPQVERAVVQVSKLLPQLEENEQAVWEAYEKLEKNRQTIYSKNDEVLEDYERKSGDVEKIIDKTLSWMNRVIRLRVGRQGHVIVVSRDDFTILAHENAKYVGEKLHPIGKLDTNTFVDISKVDTGKVSDKFHFFFPTSYFKDKISGESFLDAADAGIYGTGFVYKDTYILCGTTLGETTAFIFVRCFFSTLFFFLLAWLFVRFICFSLIWQKETPKVFKRKLVSYSTVGIVVVLVVTWYYQTMMDVTGDIATMNEHAKVAVEMLNTYREYRDELSAWMDDQYLEQCRLAADLIKAEGKENITRKTLEKYAKDLGVEYIDVFDKTGNVVVTNSPYDHMKISENKDDPSYAFHQLLDGREYVIVEPVKDREMDDDKQYIGVSMRNEEDLADGFVRIAVDSGLKKRLLAPIDVQTVLDNMVIGIPDYALAIDKETMQITATTGLGNKKENIEELGIDVENIKANFNGFFTIGGYEYYAGVGESEDLYLMPLVRSTDNYRSFVISIKLMLVCTVGLFTVIVLAAVGYKKVMALKTAEFSGSYDAAENEETKDNERKAQSDSDNDEEDWNLLSNMIKKNEKRGFERRWNRENDIPPEQQSPETRAWTIFCRMLLIISTVILLFEISLIGLGTKAQSLDGFSYVFLGNWQKGVSLFSFSYCMFLFCVLYVFRTFFNRILYHLARISDLKHETVFLLLRNAVKYACAIVFLYIGLAQFGVNTEALWASAGVLSLMIGFGAKDLTNDIIAGIFIIFEGTYKVGDWVSVGSWFGTVEEIGLRYTKVSYYADTKIINNSSMRDVVNSVGDVAKETVKVPIPYETDLLQVEKLLNQELPLMPEKIPWLVKPPKYDGVDSLEENGVLLRIKVLCQSWRRRKAKRAVFREIKLLFDREGIHVPYNHIVVGDYEKEVNTYTFTPKDENETTEGSSENDSSADIR
ncbi:MAG: mechanosensitive ion channel family protein [Firmicutes bacterium]|nr:mechanosensitive ion channel family protein [Bacillota bacterium]